MYYNIISADDCIPKFNLRIVFKTHFESLKSNYKKIRIPADKISFSLDNAGNIAYYYQDSSRPVCLMLSIYRSGSGAAATSKTERIVIKVNGWKPFTIITKRSILDVAAVLDPPLTIINYFIEHALNLMNFNTCLSCTIMCLFFQQCLIIHNKCENLSMNSGTLVICNLFCQCIRTFENDYKPVIAYHMISMLFIIQMKCFLSRQELAGLSW